MADRRWIDFITQEVNDTWDDANPGQPKTMGYVGSEEFIRLQFEEYLLSMISSVKYHNHLSRHGHNPKQVLTHVEGDPAVDFGLDWVDAWSRTGNYRMWDRNTEPNLFDIVEPRHPCAGGLTIDDVQRRIAQQVQDLHLDERFAVGREVLGRNLAAGREKANTIFNRLYADMETLREAQRKRAEEANKQQYGGGGNTPPPVQNGGGGGGGAGAGGGVDAARAHQAGQSVGSRAGAYMNSWAVWAGEKRKAAGWGRTSSTSASTGSGSGSSGWGSGWGRSRNRNSYASMSDTGLDRELPKTPLSQASSPRFSNSSALLSREDVTDERPPTQASFSESLLDEAESTSPGSSHPASPESKRRVPGAEVEAEAKAADPSPPPAVAADSNGAAGGSYGTTPQNGSPRKSASVRIVQEESDDDEGDDDSDDDKPGFHDPELNEANVWAEEDRYRP